MKREFTTSPTSCETERQQERAREYEVEMEGVGGGNSGRQKQRGRTETECTKDTERKESKRANEAGVFGYTRQRPLHGVERDGEMIRLCKCM